MKSFVLRLLVVMSMLIVGLTGSTALAQDDEPVDPVLGAVNIIDPDLYVMPEGGEEVRLIEASVFDPGETLRTDEGGVALITWFYDGTESALGTNSSVSLNEFSGEAAGDYMIDLTLNQGHLVSGLGGVAADISENGEMVVEAPDFTVRPLRGQFELIVNETGETTLIVTEGRVEVLVGDDVAVTVDENHYLVGAPGEPQVLTEDGVTPNMGGVCTAETPTNLNVRLAPTEESRRLGGLEAGQIVWVRSATEGRLWLQIYYETAEDDEEGRNYGWIYGPAVTLDEANCVDLLHAPLAGVLYGGPGVDEPLGEEAESDPIGTDDDTDTETDTDNGE